MEIIIRGRAGGPPRAGAALPSNLLVFDAETGEEFTNIARMDLDPVTPANPLAGVLLVYSSTKDLSLRAIPFTVREIDLTLFVENENAPYLPTKGNIVDQE